MECKIFNGECEQFNIFNDGVSEVRKCLRLKFFRDNDVRSD